MKKRLFYNSINKRSNPVFTKTILISPVHLHYPTTREEFGGIWYCLPSQVDKMERLSLNMF